MDRQELAHVRARNLPALTGIRGFAAGWVVVVHLWATVLLLLPGLRFLAPWATSGYLGVEVFFVLSGFIIAHTYTTTLVPFRWRHYGRYLLARFARIYPVYLVALLAVTALLLGAAVLRVGIGSRSAGPLDFVANLLLLQSVPPFHPLELPAWSISAECGAYLVFPVLAVLIARFRSSVAAFVTAACVVVAAAIGLALALSAFGPSNTAYPMIWLRIATEFSTGVLLWAGWSRLHAARTGRRWDLLLGGGVLAVLVALTFVGGTGPLAFLVLPGIAAVVLAAAASTGPLGTFLALRPVQWVGRISYSMYLVHYIVFRVLEHPLGSAGLVHAPLWVRVAAVLGAIALVVLLSAAAYHLIEEPGRRLIKRWTTPRRDDAAHPAAVASPVRAP